MNRESWLTEVSERCRPLFAACKLPSFQITCGWPCRAAMGKRRRIGECHGPKSHPNGIYQLFISPTISEPIEVAGTIVHELVHVAVGVEATHGKQFIRLSQTIGLTKGRPTSASPGTALTDKLRKIVDKVGKYPHVAMVLSVKVVTREPCVISLECDCGCRITIGRKMLDEFGAPTCSCSGKFQPVKE